MKDAADNKTPDMIDTAKKRGRPATGKAKTAAERKRAQRKRDRHNMSGAFRNKVDWETITTSALCDELRNCTEGGFPSLTAAIMKELAKRAMKNEDARFQRENEPKNNYKVFVTVTSKHEKIENSVTVTEQPEEEPETVTVTKSKATPKYRSAKGETWSGRGQRPAWVQLHN